MGTYIIIAYITYGEILLVHSRIVVKCHKPPEVKFLKLLSHKIFNRTLIVNIDCLSIQIISMGTVHGLATTRF